MEKFFPHAKASQLRAEEVQQHLRTCFEQWGLPHKIRVDNGQPWATTSDIPSALALWLTGLEVNVHLNRPRQSTDNGIVERDHGVLAGWVEPHKAHCVADLQKQIDWAIKMQRERYPVAKKLSRLQRFPTLFHNTRTYSPEQEVALWQLQRVDVFLAKMIWTRRVDKVGRVSLFSSAYSVGRGYAGTSVHLHFDPTHRQWIIETEQGIVLKRYPCTEITPERILSFTLTKRAKSVSHEPG